MSGRWTPFGPNNSPEQTPYAGGQLQMPTTRAASAHRSGARLNPLRDRRPQRRSIHHAYLSDCAPPRSWFACVIARDPARLVGLGWANPSSVISNGAPSCFPTCAGLILRPARSVFQRTLRATTGNGRTRNLNHSSPAPAIISPALADLGKGPLDRSAGGRSLASGCASLVGMRLDSANHSVPQSTLDGRGSGQFTGCHPPRLTRHWQRRFSDVGAGCTNTGPVDPASLLARRANHRRQLQDAEERLRCRGELRNGQPNPGRHQPAATPIR
jgi:hypothetical protein